MIRGGEERKKKKMLFNLLILIFFGFNVVCGFNDYLIMQQGIL